MGNLTQRPAHTDISVLLRALSEATPAGTRWQTGFASLETALLLDPRPTCLPDLLRLAAAQHSCRLQYLQLLDSLWCGPATHDPNLAQAIHDAEPLMRDWLVSDPWPPTRAAAARIIAYAGGADRADFLNRMLRMEKDPTTAATILGLLHPLRMAVPDPLWSGVLAQFTTPCNSRAVRLQAACCTLQVNRFASPELLALLGQHLYCPRERTSSQAVFLIASHATMLPREEAVKLWADLLASTREFDGAAEIACHLLRTCCDDHREGWDAVLLGSMPAPGASALPSRLRRVCASAYRHLTGRLPRLPLAPGEWPARHYPRVTAFPPRLDPAEPCLRAALHALVNCEPLWQGHTDLWRLFGLPAERQALRRLSLPAAF